MRKYFAIAVSVLVVLGALSLAAGSADLNYESGVGTEGGVEDGTEDILQTKDDDIEILDEDIQKKVSSKSEDELIEVMIRLTPHEFEGNVGLELDEKGTEYVSELKAHSKEQQSEIREFLKEGNGEGINTFWIANAILAEVEVGALNQLAEFEQVKSVHENFEIELQDSEAYKPLFKDQKSEAKPQANETSDNMTWGLDRIGVSDVWKGGEIWQQGYNGSDVKIAVSDTGMDIDHPDLEGKMVTVDENDPHYPGGWIEIDEDGDIVEDSTPNEQNIGHGTHISGTLVGGNASGRNIGAAPGAQLMHVGTYSSTYPVYSQLLASLEWKLEPRDRHGNLLNETYGGDIEDYRPDVASMSWGGDYEEYKSEFEEPIQNLRRAGIVPVTSMGNSGEGTIGTPGSIYEDIAVGASDPEDNIAEFSSGDIVEDGREDTPEKYVKPDFAAPGVVVNSSVPEDHWGTKWIRLSGTSMATPHVAGTVALMLDANANLTVDEIYEALKISADYHEAGESLFLEEKNTRYGHGIINADKAVDYVSGLAVRRPENITNNGATLKAEILEMPVDGISELDVFFRYREEDEENWSTTQNFSISQPQEFSVELEGLNSGTTYEYKPVARADNSEETTFSLTFTTHEDVDTLTWPAENITSSSATLRGEVAHIYRENTDVFFRYRDLSEESWSETDLITIDRPLEFESIIEGLDYNTVYEYKVVGLSDGEEFTGNVLKFNTTIPKPEWDEQEGAYKIYNTGELQWMKNDLESDYILKDNINASETQDWYGEKGFEPIGGEENPFKGSFDGEGNLIKGLHINRSNTDYVGLFSQIDTEAAVKNLGLTDVKINGSFQVGGIVGTNYGALENLYVTGDVNGTKRVGGLVGRNLVGTLERTYATATVSGVDSVIGGLIGDNRGPLKNSYGAGYVIGERNTGGLTGSNYDTVSDSFWDIQTSSIEESEGGTGKYTGEMVMEETFTEAGWDFEENWDIQEGESYPFFSWQETDTYPYAPEYSFFEVGIGEYDEEVGRSEEVTVEYEVTNTGDIEDTQDVEFYVDDNLVETEEDIVLGGGDVYEGEFLWSAKETGEYDLEVSSENDMEEITLKVMEYYSLTIEIEGKGSVEVNGEEVEDGWTETYVQGENVNITAIPDDGWELKEWSGTDETGEEIKITVDENMTVTARFDEEGGDDIPGFTSTLLLLAVVLALAIYKRERSGKG